MTDIMTDPTPRPWRANMHSVGIELLGDTDAGPDVEGIVDEKYLGEIMNSADAEHIVTCVNRHDELVSALKSIIRVAGKRLLGRRPHSNDIAWVKDEIEKARTLLIVLGEIQPDPPSSLRKK